MNSRQDDYLPLIDRLARKFYVESFTLIRENIRFLFANACDELPIISRFNRGSVVACQHFRTMIISW